MKPDPTHSDSLRLRLCRWMFQRCLARGRELCDDELRRDSLVFAPHPDDEVLGCGGSIALMRGLGAEVDVVFLTDGERSHAGAAVGDLAARRRAEARAAAEVLRVDAARLSFLGFEDGRLASQAERARDAVAAILAERRPQQIFVPSALDPHPDHRATSAIVRAAMREPQSRVLEYSVHLWRLWPWCRRAPNGEAYVGPRSILGGTLASARTLSRFARFTRVGEVREAKRRALEAHVSQSSPLLPGGPNLLDWSDGDFAGWIFSQYEFFGVPERSP